MVLEIPLIADLQELLRQAQGSRLEAHELCHLPESADASPTLPHPLFDDAFSRMCNPFEMYAEEDARDESTLLASLPQLVVIGAQSAGKSSLVESLVGLGEVLPRGCDLVTRRPLVLNLVPLPSTNRKPSMPAAGNGSSPPMTPLQSATPPKDQKRWWAEFAHAPGQIFSNSHAIRTEIEAETARYVGGGSSSKRVSREPIHLTIHSPHVRTPFILMMTIPNTQPSPHAPSHL